MYATLNSTPGVISQIFLCTNAPSSFQRRPRMTELMRVFFSLNYANKHS